MGAGSPRRRFIAGAGLLAVFVLLAVVPWSELASFLQFQLAPERAKLAHVVRFRQASHEDRELVLVGSAHYLHIEAGGGYPLWELKSLMTALRPTRVFVEIRPESIQAGRWGEGPVEMPFCAHAARDQGIPVYGIDDWAQPMAKREHNMVQELTRNLGAGLNLTFVGFSHVEGFSELLLDQGFEPVEWEDGQPGEAFSTQVDERYPSGLRESYQAAITAVEEGTSPFDAGWAEKRRGFVSSWAER